MVHFYLYDKEKFIREIHLNTKNPLIISGFLAGAHIQWKNDYDKGFYPSRTESFDLMNVQYKIESKKFYELRYRNLYFQFIDKDFLTGLDTYFKTFKLERPKFDIRHNMKQIYPFGDKPDELSIEEYNQENGIQAPHALKLSKKR